MHLSKENLRHISFKNIETPDDSIFQLPEKVLQFGTGVLLRSLPDFFINKANLKQVFNGRIVVVKSTTNGDSTAFSKQNGLYTVCVRGIENGKETSENIVNSSISRVLNAQGNWDQILKCAYNPDMQIIISNTTEVGIQLVNEDVKKYPPISFPGKLLAFLYERYQAFSGSDKSGMVIIPTELITDNGKVLKSIILQLAQLNNLETSYIEWLEKCNHFCSSLVDRIVPGKPDSKNLQSIESQLGYEDELLIIVEAYTMWAIEGGDEITDLLSFSSVDPGIIITSDINLFRELKLRILNGTHSLSCAVAFLYGLDTVKEAMEDKEISAFIANTMFEDVLSSIPYPIEEETKKEFAKKVLDRFRNPSINHLWLSISMQYSSKLKLRVVPLIIQHYSKSNKCPEHFALGFAAYIAFLKPTKFHNNKYFGERNGIEYIINDDNAIVFNKRWQNLSPEEVVNDTLKDINYWGIDLYKFHGFAKSISQYLQMIINGNILQALKSVNSKT